MAGGRSMDFQVSNSKIGEINPVMELKNITYIRVKKLLVFEIDNLNLNR